MDPHDTDLVCLAEFKLFREDVVDSIKGSLEIIICMKTWDLLLKRKYSIMHVTKRGDLYVCGNCVKVKLGIFIYGREKKMYFTNPKQNINLQKNIDYFAN